MAENKMEEVAALLGLELGERFKISTSNFEYALKHDGLKLYRNAEAEESADYILEDLLKGQAQIIKKTWKPEVGSIYFWAGHSNIYESWWKGDMRDYAFYAVGNCFETRNEAFNHRGKVVACLKSIYENGRQE